MKNKHTSKKFHAVRGTVGKTAVLGMRERIGRTIAKPIESTRPATLTKRAPNALNQVQPTTRMIMAATST